MRGAVKMAMMKNLTRSENDQQSEPRGSMNHEAWNNYRMERGGSHPMNGGYTYSEGGSGAESRRDRMGRYAPRNENENRPMQIGFRMDEPSRYRSDTSYPRMNESEHRTSKMDKGHASVKGAMKLDKRTAEEWVQKMGQKWSMHQVEELMKQLGIECDPMECYIAMNMMYSDFKKVAQKHGCDNPDFWLNMAKAFLEDEDAVRDKLAMYYECIVEH